MPARGVSPERVLSKDGVPLSPPRARVGTGHLRVCGVLRGVNPNSTSDARRAAGVSRSPEVPRRQRRGGSRSGVWCILVLKGFVDVSSHTHTVVPGPAPEQGAAERAGTGGVGRTGGRLSPGGVFDASGARRILPVFVWSQSCGRPALCRVHPQPGRVPPRPPATLCGSAPPPTGPATRPAGRGPAGAPLPCDTPSSEAAGH